METTSLLLTTQQAAQYLNISPGALRKLYQSGELHPIRLSLSPYSRLRFWKDDLDRWVREQIDQERGLP